MRERTRAIFELTYTEPVSGRRYFRTVPGGTLRRLVTAEHFAELNQAIDRWAMKV